MKPSDRRTFLRRMTALAAFPLLPAPLAAAGRGTVAFPAGPIELERQLDRHLADGALIRVRRSWLCAFEALGAGARVRATQVSASVDAPPALAAFAQIEQQRDASGIFPLELDRAGMIVGWEGKADAGLDQAVMRALALIRSAVIDGDAQREAAAFVRQVASAAAALVSAVPRDLFFPEPGRRAETHPVPLAGGLTGSYEVVVEAEAGGPGGLLSFSERRVTTRIGESSRETREAWTIRPA